MHCRIPPTTLQLLPGGRGDFSVPEASILILAKNEAHNLPRCLDAVFAQNTAATFEVVLVDSGSEDATLEVARRYPLRIFGIPAEQFHHARTRNYAATLAQGNTLVYLAADACPVSSRWLESLLSHLREPAVAAVYGRHLPKPGSDIERQFALSALYGAERIFKTPANREQLGYRYYHFSTVNATIRKDVWQQTRFREDLPVFEDVAIAKRILDRGWTIVYEPEASVYHSHDYGMGKLFKRYYDIGAVYQRLEIWSCASKSSVRHDGLRTVIAKLAEVRHQTLKTVLRSLLCDALKFAGIILGRNERYLPLLLKRRLSTLHLRG
jgi:rhamnosyltransferase